MSERANRMIVAVAAVVVREPAHPGDPPRVLAMRRAEGRPGAGLWETLAGRLEEGEEPLAAVMREIEEESGVEVDVDPRPLDAYAAMRGDEPMVVVVYRARWRSGEVRRSAEHDEHRWCTAEEFAETSTLERLVVAVRRAVQRISE